MSAERKPRAHLLVVDDDRLVLATLARGLREAGYDVSAAASGPDALAAVARSAPDLALLDVRMPGMDGVELGRLLREGAGVPFLYLSAYGQAEVVQQAVEHGALGYLVKPLDVAQIVPSIEAALARAREIRGLREKHSQLSTALAGSREVSMVVGLLMVRECLDRGEAFELLRSHARAQRRALAEVARELLESAEKLNAVSRLRPRGRRPRGD
ncbi:MAG TPA: response regulator [Burkholderiales bacterium]|nr:response regulator [Burkholderiales bacterium]